jgi:uncharacterized protein YllA (UPF0747 family)
MKNTQRKEREARFVTESDKKAHFDQVVNKSVEIINRQFKKISKCAKGRTYSYSPLQVSKLNEYLLSQVDKTTKRLLRTVEQEQEFNIGD